MAATPNNVGDRLERAIADRADFEHEIARGEAAGEPERRHLVRTAIWLAMTAISLYLVAPSLLDVLSSWRRPREDRAALAGGDGRCCRASARHRCGRCSGWRSVRGSGRR